MKEFSRRLALLDILGRAGEPLTTEQLADRLWDESHFEANTSRSARLRSVQRDLQAFLEGDTENGADPDSNEWGLRFEAGRGRERRWSLGPHRFQFRHMPGTLALALILLRKRLSQLLPKSSLESLEGLFSQAEESLDRSERKFSPRHFRRLSDAVGFYQRGQVLQPPEFDQSQLDLVYHAILLGQSIDFHYKEKDYRVTPLGVAFRLPKIYLIARKGTAGLRHFLVPEISQTRLVGYCTTPEEVFDLDAYVSEGHLDMLIDRGDRSVYPVRIRLHLQNERGELLSELESYPIAGDQRIIRDEQHQVAMLEFSSRRTIQLRNWILSLGKAAEVVQPQALKRDLREILKQTLDAYLESQA